MSEFEQNVLKKLDEINQKLDKVLNMSASPAAAAPVASAPSTAPASAPAKISPSALVEKQAEEAKLVEKPPTEGRRKCPDCGGTSFNSVEDKTQMLSAMGGIKIYAKKNICRGCGKEVA